MLRLGRILGVPLSPTELLLAATLPLAVAGLPELRSVSATVAAPLLAFMGVGWGYLLWGLAVEPSMSALRWEGLLSEERIRLLLSWRHLRLLVPNVSRMDPETATFVLIPSLSGRILEPGEEQDPIHA
jgi:hypothetical protein